MWVLSPRLCPGFSVACDRTQLVYAAVVDDREYPVTHAPRFRPVASRCPPRLEERLLHEILTRLTLPDHPVCQRLCRPAMAVIERGECSGISTLGKGYQIVVRHNKILRQFQTAGSIREDAGVVTSC